MFDKKSSIVGTVEKEKVPSSPAKRQSFCEVKNNEQPPSTEASSCGEKETIKVGSRRYLGIALALITSAIVELCVLIQKVLSQYDAFSIAIWRFQGILVPALFIIAYFRGWRKGKIFDTFWPPNNGHNLKISFLMIIRVVAGTSSIVLQIYSLQYVSMADSSVIAYSSPVFVALTSHILLGERTGVIPILCGILTFLGVSVITRPPLLTGGEEFDQNVLIGSAFALGSMICSSANFLLLRYLRKIHFSVMTTSSGLIGTLQCLIFALAFKTFQLPQGLHDWLLAGALACLTFIGQICFVCAFKFEQAATVSLCRTSDILFVYLWQFLFLGVGPDLFSVVGSLIIVFAVVVVGLRKLIAELPKNHSARRRLSLLLK